MTEQDELRKHSYDGIQEYDNDLPRWWIWLFVLTVVFAVVYPFIYDFGPGEFASETVDAEVAALAKRRPATNVADGEVSEASLLELAKSADVLVEGKQLFATRCAACHGELGQGVVGPNLTDEYTIHGADIRNIHRIVRDGVLEKGMLAWKSQLTPEQLQAVVAFVWTLRGTNPPNPKPAQGEKAVSG